MGSAKERYWPKSHAGRMASALEVHRMASELYRMGLNLGPATNTHPGVSQAGLFINVSAVPRMDVKLGIPFASISW